MLKVSYKEWLENVYNPAWKGWNDLKEIMKEIGPSRSFPNEDQWIQHSICFLNNYILEKKVKTELALEFKTDDHEYLIGYKGVNEPDFISPENGETFELKQGRDVYSFKEPPVWTWHNADRKLYFCRNEKALYEVIDGELEKIMNLTVAHINPDEVAYIYNNF